MSKTSFSDSQFLISQTGKKNRISRFLTLRNRHSSSCDIKTHAVFSRNGRSQSPIAIRLCQQCRNFPRNLHTFG